MRHTARLLGALVLVLAAASPVPAAETAGRTEKLREALGKPGLTRSVFFIRGMTCRACTLLVDRRLNKREGVYWARFNYPLRLLVAYHDPGKATADDIAGQISGAGEIEATLMKSVPAEGLAFSQETPAASWKAGELSFDEALNAPDTFAASLENLLFEKGTEDWHQIAWEIAGEEVRNRILRRTAEESGYTPGGPAVEIPVFISKDFYWPVDKLPPSPAESAVSRFLREKVILDSEDEEGRARFDKWLLGLWQKVSLDFRGEVLELEGGSREGS